MKKLMILSAVGLALAACQEPNVPVQPYQQPTPAPTPVPTNTGSTTSVSQTDGGASQQVTISGGAGSQCLAVDVLANDGAFIRAGTAGTLSGDVFTVNGQAHDMSGINYSVKGC